MKMKTVVLLCIVQGCFGAAIVGDRLVCSGVCPDNYSPVCASNGQTYSNKCYLDMAKCHDNSISLVSEGKCVSVSSRSVSICPAIGCFALYDPVCGTDGKTYSNECNLHVTHCHGDVTLAYRGPC